MSYIPRKSYWECDICGQTAETKTGEWWSFITRQWIQRTYVDQEEGPGSRLRIVHICPKCREEIRRTVNDKTITRR